MTRIAHADIPTQKQKAGGSNVKHGNRTLLSRRTALKSIGAAGVAAVAAPAPGVAQAPAVRRRVTLSCWTWSDNPGHQKMLVDVVDAYNKSQDMITVQQDAGSRAMEVRQKLLVAHAAGAAPDVGGVVQTNVQEYFDAGVMAPVETYFSKWDEKGDYFPNVVAFMHSKPGQPLLYMPSRISPYMMFYRADWFDELKLAPPRTYDEFIEAARRLTRPGERAGVAIRGLDYYAVQPIEPIWGSAGVKFVDAQGNVDFDSPAAVAITEKWVGMYTKDKSAQPTAVNDSYPQLFSLMERGRAAMWLYANHAHPQLMTALGDRIQATSTPNVAPGNCMLAIPEGDFMTSSCKEKEAAWDFLQYLAGNKAVPITAMGRGYLPVRKSLSADPALQSDRFSKVAIANEANWWTPPFAAKNWAAYQDRIAPYWQQALRQEITPKQWNEQAAKLLRGEA
jgi:multiple sugar transport system substrate-binding protein